MKPEKITVKDIDKPTVYQAGDVLKRVFTQHHDGSHADQLMAEVAITLAKRMMRKLLDTKLTKISLNRQEYLVIMSVYTDPLNCAMTHDEVAGLKPFADVIDPKI